MVGIVYFAVIVIGAAVNLNQGGAVISQIWKVLEKASKIKAAAIRQQAVGGKWMVAYVKMLYVIEIRVFFKFSVKTNKQNIM